MQQFDVPVIHKTYEFYHSLHALHRTIPKTDRHTVWQRSENTTLEILEGLIRIGYLPLDSRISPLTDVSIRLDVLRVLIRLSLDVKALPQKKYVLLEEKMNEIGRMIGGWLKSLKPKP